MSQPVTLTRTTFAVSIALMYFLIAGSSFEKVGAAQSLAKPGDVQSKAMLTGMVRSATGKALEGIAISVRDVEKTFTTTVFTDEQGRYFFPLLDNGRYKLWAQTVGYEMERTEVLLEPGKVIHQDFGLKTRDDFTNQLSGAEWVDALPSDTPENHRMKEIFQHTCTGCHTPSFVLQNRFDRDGWLAILTVMERETAAGEWAKERGNDVHHFKEELADYLAKVRGPDSSPMQFHPLPRPTGDAARAVFTEYDIPPGETPDHLAEIDGSIWSEGTPSAFLNRGTHDVTEDFSGNAWFTSTRPRGPNHRSYGKIDTKTGKITDFEVPGANGWMRSSHEVTTASDGMIWITFESGGIGTGSLGRINPQTEKIDIFNAPEGMTPITPGGGHTDVDGKGKVWIVTRKGGLRFDPVTSQFTDFISPGANDPKFSTYGLAADAEGNGWWAIITEDKVGIGDPETGKSREVQYAPRPGMRELATAEDIAWYDRTDHLKPLADNTSALWSRTPRRMAGDHFGHTMWSADFLGQDIAAVDIRSLKVKYFDLPVPYASAYDVHVDDKHIVWVSLRNADRVGKFDPATKRWIVYKLPSLGDESRNIYADEFGKTGDVWLASWRDSKVIRLQTRTRQELEVMQAKINATKNAVSVVSARSNLTNYGSSETITESSITGKGLFLQRCSLCHMGVPPGYQTYGPPLHRELVAARGDDVIRKVIMAGSARMPGWKYGLSQTDIDKILTYLKTVTKEEVTHSSSGEGPQEDLQDD